MDIYLDEKQIPSCCLRCKHSGLNAADGMSCYHYAMEKRGEIFCNFSEATYRHKDCPLHSIQEHDKKVKNQIVEKIMEKYNLENKPIVDEFGDTSFGYASINAKRLKEFLIQILEETDEES